MDSILHSPEVKWISRFELVPVRSVRDFLSYVPIASTVVATSAVFVMARAQIGGNAVTSLFCGVVAAHVFTRYFWFHFFIQFRQFCVALFEIQIPFCREFVEPITAAAIAWGLLKKAIRIQFAKKKSTVINPVVGPFAGLNVNNSSRSGCANGDIPPQICLGQLFYCGGCGRVSWESEEPVDPDPFPAQVVDVPYSPSARSSRNSLTAQNQNQNHLAGPQTDQKAYDLSNQTTNNGDNAPSSLAIEKPSSRGILRQDAQPALSEMTIPKCVACSDDRSLHSSTQGPTRRRQVVPTDSQMGSKSYKNVNFCVGPHNLPKTQRQPIGIGLDQ